MNLLRIYQNTKDFLKINCTKHVVVVSLPLVSMIKPLVYESPNQIRLNSVVLLVFPTVTRLPLIPVTDETDITYGYSERDKKFGSN